MRERWWYEGSVAKPCLVAPPDALTCGTRSPSCDRHLPMDGFGTFFVVHNTVGVLRNCGEASVGRSHYWLGKIWHGNPRLRRPRAAQRGCTNELGGESLKIRDTVHVAVMFHDRGESCAKAVSTGIRPVLWMQSSCVEWGAIR